MFLFPMFSQSILLTEKHIKISYVTHSKKKKKCTKQFRDISQNLFLLQYKHRTVRRYIKTKISHSI